MREDNALILLCKLQIALFASLFLNILHIACFFFYFGSFLGFGAFWVVCLILCVVCCLVVGFLLLLFWFWGGGVVCLVFFKRIQLKKQFKIVS